MFLSTLGVKDHLLLSMKKTNRFGKVLCSGAQRLPVSGEMGGEDAVVGSGGVAGNVAGVAFGVKRRICQVSSQIEASGGLDCRMSRFGWGAVAVAAIDTVSSAKV